MQKAKAKFKQLWEENPILVVIIGSAVAQTVLAAVKTSTEARNSRTWAKEVKRRNRMS